MRFGVAEASATSAKRVFMAPATLFHSFPCNTVDTHSGSRRAGIPESQQTNDNSIHSMKTKIILSRVAPVAVLVAALGVLAFSGHESKSIAGAWVNTFDFPGDPNTLVQSEIILPLDPSGATYAATFGFANPVQNYADHTIGRPTGTYVRVGPNRYKFTLTWGRGLGPTEFPGRAAYLTLHVLSGTAYLTDQDTLVNDGVLAIFAASQDVAPRDGFPDAGEVPVAVAPWMFEAKRVEVQEPYPLQ